MRIGIDIDGVLTDMGQYVLDYGSRFFYNNYKKEIINIDKFEVYDVFNCPRKLHDEFWNKYFIEYVKTESPRKFADEVINKLHKEGNEIYIITSRFYAEKELEEYKELKEAVINWLKKYNIYFDKVIFSPEDKTQICIEENIELMIEDSIHNVTNLSKIIPVICYNTLYNKKCKGKNIIRCYSWYDIYAKIRNLKQFNPKMN